MFVDQERARRRLLLELRKGRKTGKTVKMKNKETGRVDYLLPDSKAAQSGSWVRVDDGSKGAKTRTPRREEPETGGKGSDADEPHADAIRAAEQTVQEVRTRGSVQVLDAMLGQGASWAQPTSDQGNQWSVRFDDGHVAGVKGGEYTVTLDLDGGEVSVDGDDARSAKRLGAGLNDRLQSLLRRSGQMSDRIAKDLVDRVRTQPVNRHEDATEFTAGVVGWVSTVAQAVGMGVAFGLLGGTLVGQIGILVGTITGAATFGAISEQVHGMIQSAVEKGAKRARRGRVLGLRKALRDLERVVARAA